MVSVLRCRFDWTPQTRWLWPASDAQLIQVIDYVDDIDRALSYVTDWTACVQAGGACGLWPLRLAGVFGRVYTYEPDATNFACLLANTLQVDNVQAFNAPVSDTAEKYVMKRDRTESDNAGAGYIELSRGRGGVTSLLIDDLQLTSCGFIQLDVEGSELQALKGGERTIAKCRPVIMLEEKLLPHMKPGTAARDWLVGVMGYTVVASVHRDIILCP